MENRKYRHLSRRDLLELLIEESEKNEKLERQLKQAHDELASRELKMENAGSIAEASLALSGIFEAAEDACAHYIENIRRMSAEQDKINAEREAESQKKAEKIIQEANHQARSLEASVRERCKKMIALAKAEAASAAGKAAVSSK